MPRLTDEEFNPKIRGFLLECSSGWYPLINDLANSLDEIDLNWEPLQIKEKFGTLRFYWGNEFSAEDAKKANALVDAAERRSSEICEICGNSERIRRGSWWKTLCDDHTK